MRMAPRDPNKQLVKRRFKVYSVCEALYTFIPLLPEKILNVRRGWSLLNSFTGALFSSRNLCKRVMDNTRHCSLLDEIAFY